jgi:hypothetical protein
LSWLKWFEPRGVGDAVAIANDGVVGAMIIYALSCYKQVCDVISFRFMV